MTLAVVVSLVTGNSIAVAGEGDIPEKGWSPFQFSIFSPIQLVGENKSITGLRLSLLYGKNTEVSGIDLGLGVSRSNSMTGIQISGVVNYTQSDHTEQGRGWPITHRSGDEANTAKGIQIGGLGNQVDYLSGIQVVGIANVVRYDAIGIQVALLANEVNGTIRGIQIGGINNFLSPKTSGVIGIQIGLFNFAGDVTGVQIGLFNFCVNLSGIQIGLLNYIEQGRFPLMPIVNAKF